MGRATIGGGKPTEGRSRVPLLARPAVGGVYRLRNAGQSQQWHPALDQRGVEFWCESVILERRKLPHILAAARRFAWEVRRSSVCSRG
jgi:hypothetical protein